MELKKRKNTNILVSFDDGKACCMMWAYIYSDNIAVVPFYDEYLAVDIETGIVLYQHDDKDQLLATIELAENDNYFHEQISEVHKKFPKLNPHQKN